MLHFIIFTCFLHFSVGEIIHGRILLDGNANKLNRLPFDSILIVQLQDSSLADAPVTVLRRAEFSHLVAFPIFYEIEIPTSISPAFSYSLSARITKGDKLLYINDQHISVQMEADSSIMIDIPVINVNQDPVERKWLDDRRKSSWPEMLGQKGAYVVEYIKEKSGLTNVFTVLDGSPISMDYQEDRVLIFVEENDVVIQIPRSG